MIHRVNKLSCGRMIRLLARPPSPSFSLYLNLPLCRWSILLTGGGRGLGGGRGAKSYDPEKEEAWLALHKSFNTLWALVMFAYLPVELNEGIAAKKLLGAFLGFMLACTCTIYTVSPTLQRNNTENLKQIFPEKEKCLTKVPISTCMCL